MKSLDEFNEEARRRRDDSGKPQPNGITCPIPKCSKELWDSSPMVTLTTDPPQKNVHCPACGFRGYRLT